MSVGIDHLQTPADSVLSEAIPSLWLSPTAMQDVELGQSIALKRSLPELSGVIDVKAGGVVAYGVTLFESFEMGPTPIALSAATPKTYVSPFTRPVAVQSVVVLEIDVGQALIVSVLDVVSSANTSYPVIALPPSFAGAVQVIKADPLPAVATIPVGASDTLANGMAPFDGAEKAPVPTGLIAATLNV
jgi:hypothetical protein